MKALTIERKVVQSDVLVVGSGAAGFNAAVNLKKQGLERVILLSSGLNRGTSRNTGSDKQTYYKLGLSGNPDGIMSMAETLFSGGAMDGPTAMAEAAFSARGFLHLADIGVPFPQDRYGCFPGYKTDHDPAGRASSCGPYTSRDMTNCLQQEALAWGVELWDGYQMVRLLTVENRILGVAALNLHALKNERIEIVYFLSSAVVYAVGASAGMYGTSVYPASQWGGIGTALRAGAPAVNLTEWQYGLASLHPRWNLSGSYQQVIPRYFSVNENGEEEEFLLNYFSSLTAMVNAIFLKGYQWPFDAEKTRDEGSSIIDLAVWQQRQMGRKVYMDFRRNPMDMRWDELWQNLDETARTYLNNSRAIAELPVDRLAFLNMPAIDLYRDKGRDLYKEPLEIAVCAQHQNGGLKVDHWWRSPLDGLYPVGECAGTHGVRRPGGAALNSGQVGSLRAAQWISAHRQAAPEWSDLLDSQAASLEHHLLMMLEESDGQRPSSLWRAMKKRMDSMSHVRSLAAAQEIAEASRHDQKQRISVSCLKELEAAFALEDWLLTQEAMAEAVIHYIKENGGSRGSCLIADDEGELRLPGLICRNSDRSHDGQIQEIVYNEKEWNCSFRDVLPLPREVSWFETAWAAYRSGKIYN